MTMGEQVKAERRRQGLALDIAGASDWDQRENAKAFGAELKHRVSGIQPASRAGYLILLKNTYP